MTYGEIVEELKISRIELAHFVSVGYIRKGVIVDNLLMPIRHEYEIIYLRKIKKYLKIKWQHNKFKKPLRLKYKTLYTYDI